MNTVKKVIKAIKDNRFSFDNCRRWYISNITPLFCSYGQIGYTFMIDDNNIKGLLSYDYELRTITFYNDKSNKEFTINI